MADCVDYPSMNATMIELLYMEFGFPLEDWMVGKVVEWWNLLWSEGESYHVTLSRHDSTVVDISKHLRNNICPEPRMITSIFIQFLESFISYKAPFAVINH